MKTRYIIILIALAILVVSYVPIITVTMGPEDVLNPAGVLYFPSIVIQLVANEGNGIICVDACGPCSAWGPHHVMADGVCKIPDKVEDCYSISPEMELEWEFINNNCVPTNWPEQLIYADDGDFGISVSNAHVLRFEPTTGIQALEIKIIPQDEGVITMDDPLPYLQELYPESNVVSYVVLVNGVETKPLLENGRISIEFDKDAELVLIIGILFKHPTDSSTVKDITPENNLPIFWMLRLNELGIEYEIPERNWSNNQVEPIAPWRACSPLAFPNGTDFYVSSVITSSFVISGMQIHDSMPDDCSKIYTTEKRNP